MSVNQNGRVSWCYNGAKYSFSTFEYMYLYSSFIHSLSHQNKIEYSTNDKFVFKGQPLVSLEKLIESDLKDLLIDFYTKPKEKELRKHSTRFEKITFENNLYIVNYRTSLFGRLIYTVHSFLETIKNAISTKGEIEVG